MEMCTTLQSLHSDFQGGHHAYHWMLRSYHLCRLDSAVVYIDTEMKFSERRVIQIMKNQLGDTASLEPVNCEHLLNRLHVIRPQTGSFSTLRW